MAHNVNGLAGCVARGKCRSTGTRTAIYIAAEQGIDADGKYVVICEDHGTLLSCYTLAQARSFKPHPMEFCDECREAA